MEFLISVSVLGTTYALLAAGIVVVYKASRVVNFAHGELAIVGAYGFWSAGLWAAAAPASPLSLLVPIAMTAGASVLFGVAIYLALMRRLLGQPTFVAAMVTIGIAIILKAAIVIVWNARSVGINIGRQTLMTFEQGGRLTFVDSVTLIAGAVFFALMFVFFHHTRLGRQFRGTAENPLLASQRQVNVNLILALAWGTAVFSASLAGVLFGSRSMLSPQSPIIGLSGLTAALVGGLDSLRGAAIGGLLVALATYVTARLISPALADAVPFALLLIVMCWRPWGIFGTPEELNRV